MSGAGKKVSLVRRRHYTSDEIRELLASNITPSENAVYTKVTGVQSAASGTLQLVSFSSLVETTESGTPWASSPNPSRIYTRRPGVYVFLMYCNFDYDTNLNSYRMIQARWNGSYMARRRTRNNIIHNWSAAFFGWSGIDDYFEMYVRQDSGSTHTVDCDAIVIRLPL